MTLVQVLGLSLIEGITEFLPISSTGHLILAGKLWQLEPTEFLKSYEIAIQLGAILAVVWLYWKKILTQRKLIFRVAAAFMPTAIVGFLGYSIIKTYLLSSVLIDVLALFFGGLTIILLEKFFASRPRPIAAADKLNWWQSAGIGLAQSLSVIPGVSRAAATIFGGMGLGLTRRAATEFSFLLAIPTMAGATGLDLLKSGWQFSAQEYGWLGLGFAGAFVSALFTVKWLINFVSRHSFIGFGIYRMILAVVFFLLFRN